MKKIICILTILLFALSSFACQKVELPEENNQKYLKEEIFYDHNEHEVDKKFYTHDERGNLTSISDRYGIRLYEYEEDRVIQTRADGVVSTYSYNEFKQLTEVVKVLNSEEIDKIKYEYDAADNLIKMITLNEGTEVIATYTYNRDNQMIGVLLNLDNKEYKTKLEYDKNGNCIKKTEYADGIVEFEVTSVYENDLLIKQKHDNLKEQTYANLQYEYNKDKQVIKILMSYDANSFFKSREYIYE